MRKKLLKSGYYWVRLHHNWDTEPPWEIGRLFHGEWYITGSPTRYDYKHLKEIGDYVPNPSKP